MTSQRPVTVTRRRFIGESSAAVLAAAWLGPDTDSAIAGEMSSKDKPLLRLGARLEKPPQDPEELALAHRKLGYRAAEAWRFGLSKKERIRAIREAFAKHDIVIGCVGASGNLLHPDLKTRAELSKQVRNALVQAEELGARCAVSFGGGTFSPVTQLWHPNSAHPDNRTPRFWDALPREIRRILDEVKPKYAKLAIHPMGWLKKPDDYLRLFEAVDHEGLAAFLHFGGKVEEQDFLEEWFEKLGDRTVCCHTLMQMHDPAASSALAEAASRDASAPPTALDKVHTTFLRGVATLPGEVPVLMEHMEPDEYLLLRDYYHKLGERAGIRFN